MIVNFNSWGAAFKKLSTTDKSWHFFLLSLRPSGRRAIKIPITLQMNTKPKKKRKIALANQLERKHDAHQTKNTYQIFINLHIIFIFVTDSARRAGSSYFMSLRLALHPQKNWEPMPMGWWWSSRLFWLAFGRRRWQWRRCRLLGVRQIVKPSKPQSRKLYEKKRNEKKKINMTIG